MDLSKNFDIMGLTDKLSQLEAAREKLTPIYGDKANVVIDSLHNFFEGEGFDPATVFVHTELSESEFEGKRFKPLMARAYNADLEPISGVASIGISVDSAEPLNSVH